MNTQVLLIGSTRSVGKDTLCQRLIELDPRFKRFSFADALKLDLLPFIEQRFGFNLYTCALEEKELVRPILISYGMAQRKKDPVHWIKELDKWVNSFISENPGFIAIITDARFPNEVTYFRERYETVYIQLYRKGAPPPTDEEERHWRTLASMADYTLSWGEDTVEEQREHARGLLEWLYHKT